VSQQHRHGRGRRPRRIKERAILKRHSSYGKSRKRPHKAHRRADDRQYQAFVQATRETPPAKAAKLTDPKPTPLTGGGARHTDSI
jgi:hypothetical protein